jgi:hypothetical protein
LPHGRDLPGCIRITRLIPPAPAPR